MATTIILLGLYRPIAATTLFFSGKSYLGIRLQRFKRERKNNVIHDASFVVDSNLVNFLNQNVGEKKNGKEAEDSKMVVSSNNPHNKEIAIRRRIASM